MFLPSFDEPNTGDLERVTPEKGEEDANASNPVRFAVVVVKEGGSLRPAENGEKGDTLAEDGGDDTDDLLDEKIFWPLTAAKGELADA